jgi:sugar (glycoside-pentoside-hexuronide) transporter
VRSELSKGAVEGENPRGAEDRLSVREKLGYGVGDMANGLALAATAFYLLFYLTNVVKLSPELAGAALMVGRIWDAVTDPVMGWITDRTNTRWGKRRPYLLFGAVTYGVSFFALWTVPDFSSELTTFIYVTTMLIFFNTFMTVVFIPYQTLTAAMTSDYEERISLTGYRMVLSQISFLIGATVPALIFAWAVSPSGQSWLESGPLLGVWGSWTAQEKQGYFVFAALFACLMMAAIWTAFACTRERELSSEPETVGSFGPLTYLKQLLSLLRSNRYFRSALLIKLLSTAAATIISAKLQYYVTYVLDLKQDFATIIGTLFVAAIIAVPFWVWLSKRHGKIRAFQVGMSGYCLVLALLLILGQSGGSFIYLLAVLAGFFHSAALLIPWTIIPDVVEVDEYENGKRREGLLYGGTTFAYKLGSGIAIFVAGLILGAFGFDPENTASPGLKIGILLSISLIPIALLVLSIFAARRYDLTSERHHEIVNALKVRKNSTS